MGWVMAPMPPIAWPQAPSLPITSPKVDSGKQRGSLANGQRIAAGIVAANPAKSASVFSSRRASLITDGMTMHEACSHHRGDHPGVNLRRKAGLRPVSMGLMAAGPERAEEPPYRLIAQLSGFKSLPIVQLSCVSAWNRSASTLSTKMFGPPLLKGARAGSPRVTLCAGSRTRFGRRGLWKCSPCQCHTSEQLATSSQPTGSARREPPSRRGHCRGRTLPRCTISRSSRAC